MTKLWDNYRYLIARRVMQILILVLFIASHYIGFKLLSGNLSSAVLFDSIPLSDPLAIIQVIASSIFKANDLGISFTPEVIIGLYSSFDALLGVFIVVIFYGIIGGRAFCSWVCPVNIVTDTAKWIRTKYKIDNFVRPSELKRSLRYFILLLTVILSILFGISAFEFISPISLFVRSIVFGMGVGWALILILFLFDLLVLKNGFCGYTCPLGAFYSIIGRFSLFRVRHNKDKCTKCLDCIVVCPEKQVLPMISKSSEAVLSGECTNCLRCIEVCNDDALSFGTRFYNKS